MSTFEQLFFDPGAITVDEAASLMAPALDLELTKNRGHLVLWTETDAEIAAPIGGDLMSNIYAETAPEQPSDVSIFDLLPMVFEFRVPATHWDHQQAVALVLFRRLAHGLGWPSVLTHGYADLIATYDYGRGVRTFPAGTLSDATHEHLWR